MKKTRKIRIKDTSKFDVVDYLKTEAPFWKKETTPEGQRWVDARVTDESAMRKWRNSEEATLS